MWAMARHDVCGSRRHRRADRAATAAAATTAAARARRTSTHDARRSGRRRHDRHHVAMVARHRRRRHERRDCRRWGPRRTRTRSWWGWGYEDQAVGRRRDAGDGRAPGRALRTRTSRRSTRPASPTSTCGRPRVDPPAAFADWCSTAPLDRAGHTYGKSYRDIVRAVHGDLPDPPDVVAFPPTEADVVALLDWCAVAGVAAIPYGGGSSVVGGVECAVGDGFAGVVSIDLGRLDRVLEVDPVSPGRPHPGRRARPGARGAAPPARLHAAPLPAVASSSRRSAAGWPPAPAATTPACTRTSTTSSSRCGSSRRPASASRGGCPARAPGRRPTACSSAPRAASASSPRRGCACRTGPGGGRRPASCSAATPTASRRPGPSPSPGCSPRTAGCSTAREAATAAGDAGRRRAARPRLRVGRPSRRRVDRPGRRAVPRPRRRRPRRASRTSDSADSVDAGARRRRRVVALVVPPGAVPARRAWSAAGCCSRRSRRRARGTPSPSCTARVTETVDRRAAADLRRRLGDVPVHPRLPRRPGAVLLDHRARPDRLGARDVGRDQGGRVGGAAGRRRHDHPPPRRRPRPRPLVPPPAPRRRSAGRWPPSRPSSTRPASSTRG